MQKNTKTQTIIAASLLILATLSLLGLTYAYYKSRIIGNSNWRSIGAKLGKIEVTYEDGNNEITANNVGPGDSIEKTFSVRNTGDAEANYGIIIENIINTFERYQDWTYILKKDESIIKSGTIPKYSKKIYILNNTNIKLNSTDNYSLILN